MGKRKNSEFNQSALLNNKSFIQYLDRFVQLSISVFEWINLPETIDERYMELVLYNRGQVVFFKDDDLGYLALPNAGSGRFNVYGIPVNRRALAVNGYNKELNDKDSVIIWNNMMHTGSSLEVEMYARRLWDIDRTIDVNVNAQKTPMIIKCDEHERLTLMNLYMQYKGNYPIIFADKNLNTEGISCINTQAPFVSPQLYELRTQLYNEMLSVIGISNISYQKKERLISDEVNRSLGGTIANRFTRLQVRKMACKEINEMFGLNVDCRFREEFEEKNKEYEEYDDYDEKIDEEREGVELE